MFTLFLVALITGIRPTVGFHAAFKANRRNTGFAKIAPWLQRSAGDIKTAAVSLFESVLSLLKARPDLVAATLAMAIALAHPSEAVAGFALIGVAGTMNVAQLERDLAQVGMQATSLLEKTAKACQAHTEVNAEGKEVVGRAMTTEEKAAIQTLVDKGNGIKAQIEVIKGDAALRAEIEKLTAGMNAANGHTGAIAQVKKTLGSLGQQFVDSAAGQFFLKKQHVGSSNWSSPIAELFDMRATTLTTDGASGGDLIVSDYQAGIKELLFKRLTVRDLIAPGSTDSNTVSYMEETTFTNAAATVAEGGTKPESALVFNLVTDTVRKIAHWLPVTEEMLEDVRQIRSYIDARLRLGVDLTEEDQLLNGDGTPPNISGILDRTLTAAQARGADTNADAIFKEMMKVFNASFIMPDAHVINPANWQTIQLAKDANGQYYGSGPFAGPQAPTLWGLPVAVSPSIASGTALTGAFRSQAQIFDKGGMRVEASNSHSDYFIKNLVAIRAERRLALAVYRPLAFGTTTGLN